MSGNSGIGNGEGPDPVDPDDPAIVENPCVKGDEQCVFFEKPSNWNNNVNAYIYYVNSQNQTVEVAGKWPGNNCASLGNNIYKYTLPEDAATIGTDNTWYVLFSDGQNQTQGDPGFECKQAAYYTMSGYSKTITDVCSESFVEDLKSESHIYGLGDRILVQIPVARKFKVYSVDGRLVREINAQEGDNWIEDLPAGIYIIDKSKVMIR